MRNFSWKHTVKRYVGITIGCLIASASINLFLVPSHLLTGGATGIAIIFYYLFHLPIGLQTFLYNLPLLLASLKLMGRQYTVDVIIGTGIFSFCLDILRPLNACAPLNDVMLAAIFGGVFNGIGYGLVFRMNGSTGGFDILGAILKKYYSLGMGSVIFTFNCMLMVVAGFLFGVAPAMFTLICMYMNGFVTDKVVAGFNQRKAILIVSNRAHAISDAILSELGRGVTFLHGQGRVHEEGARCAAGRRDAHAGREGQAHRSLYRSRGLHDHHSGQRGRGAGLHHARRESSEPLFPGRRKEVLAWHSSCRPVFRHSSVTLFFMESFFRGHFDKKYWQFRDLDGILSYMHEQKYLINEQNIDGGKFDGQREKWILPRERGNLAGGHQEDDPREGDAQAR